MRVAFGLRLQAAPIGDHLLTLGLGIPFLRLGRHGFVGPRLVRLRIARQVRGPMVRALHQLLAIGDHSRALLPLIGKRGRVAGDVGYIELVAFPPQPMFKPAIDRAMTAPKRHLHINDIVSRTAGTKEFTRQATNSEQTPVSFAGIPVYVLTSS